MRNEWGSALTVRIRTWEFECFGRRRIDRFFLDRRRDGRSDLRLPADNRPAAAGRLQLVESRYQVSADPQPTVLSRCANHDPPASAQFNRLPGRDDQLLAVYPHREFVLRGGRMVKNDLVELWQGRPTGIEFGWRNRRRRTETSAVSSAKLNAVRPAKPGPFASPELHSVGPAKPRAGTAAELDTVRSAETGPFAATELNAAGSANAKPVAAAKDQSVRTTNVETGRHGTCPRNRLRGGNRRIDAAGRRQRFTGRIGNLFHRRLGGGGRRQATRDNHEQYTAHDGNLDRICGTHHHLIGAPAVRRPRCATRSS